MINGSSFESMVRNGFANLSEQENIINQLNVFPVADGDTGSNMRLTIENGIKYTDSSNDLGKYVTSLSKGMLLGARGNSGVIFSQIFYGISLELGSKKYAETNDIVDALVSGYKTAYGAVVHPTEGTILTVAREGIEKIKDKVNDNTSCEELFSLYINQMKETLSHTPEMLPALREAGVIDSGGMGLICFFEGFLNKKSGHSYKVNQIKYSQPIISNTDEEVGYCTEFIIRLNNVNAFDKNSYIEYLETIGNSTLVIQDDNVVKVHIHTFEPLEVVNNAQKYGKLSNVKIDDMFAQVQNNRVKKKKVAYICVSQGEGMIDVFKNLGCDIVIDGGLTMNTSTKELLTAMNTLNADNIVILPNNSDIHMAAYQAKDLYNKSENVCIIPTKSIPEGYFAMSMVVDSGDDIDSIIRNLKVGMESVTSVIITKADHDTFSSGVKCIKGEYLTIVDKEVIACSKEISKALMAVFDIREDLQDKEIVLMIKGKNVDIDYCEELSENLQDEYSSFDVGILEGEQEIYDIILGIT